MPYGLVVPPIRQSVSYTHLVATYELIQMLLEKNNMHEFDVANIYKWVFKTTCAILIPVSYTHLISPVAARNRAQAGVGCQGGFAPPCAAALPLTACPGCALDVYKRQWQDRAHTGS